MTDTSRFLAEEQPVASQFDASVDLTRIDRNLQQISAVESTWGLPSLPDEVKADLATLPDVDEAGLFAFLTGIDDDVRRLHEGGEQEASASLPPIQNRGVDQARIIVASLSGNPAPTAVTEDAIERFKLDAIDRGLLDMRPEQVDRTWNPEFNRIRNDLAFEKYDERLRGNREGAMPLEGINKLLFDFTSPSGLLAAATELDFFWDIGAVKSEFSNWGNKWRELGESKNPVEWAGNLWDALTGPIDDIVLPIVNVGLMFAGVGAVANTGRIAGLIARGKTFDTISDIYRTTRFGRLMGGTSAVRNFEELGKASWSATRLAGRSNALARHTGELMQAWRGALPVQALKGVIQPGMRLGVVSNLEQRMGSFQGGTSLADVSDPVNDLAERMYMAGQSPVTVLPEIMIAPYNIFVPGTFVQRAGEGAGIAGKLARGGVAALGSAPGRAAVGATAGAAIGSATGEDAGDLLETAGIGAAAAAVAPRIGGFLMRENTPGAIKAAAVAAGAGALLGDDPEDALIGASAGVGIFAMSPTVRRLMRERIPSINKAIRGVGQGLDLMSFRPMADKHEPALAVHRGMVSHLENVIQSAPTKDVAEAARARLNRWNTNVRVSGVTRAMAAEMNLGTGRHAEETAAAGIVWVNTMLGIEHIAHTQARAVTGPWRARFATARNKLANQIRPFAGVPHQGTEAWFDDLAMSMALTSGAQAGSAVRRRDIEATAAQIRQRLTADPAWAMRMAQDHDEKAIETLHQVWRPENGLGAEARAELMAKYMPQIWDRFGNFPRFIAATEEIRKARATGLFDPAGLTVARTRAGRASNITNVTRRNRPLQQANAALAFQAATPMNANQLGNSWLTPAAPSVLPGRITVELADTKTGQELFELREEVLDLIDAKKHLERATGFGYEAQAAQIAPGVELHDFTRAQIAQMVAAMPGNSGDSFKYIVAFAKRKGIRTGDLATIIRDEATKFATDAAKWDAYGMPTSVADDTGRTLFGFEALQKRADDLQERWQWAAKQVDIPDLVARYRAAGLNREADEVERIAQQLADDGYKLVHGVEFVMPEDMALVPGGIWEDVSRRHMNYATLGNFFRGRLPVEGHLVADTRHRAALVNELSQLDGSPLKTVGARSEEIDGIINFLQKWLRDEQDQVEMMTRHMDLGSRTRRTGQRVLTSMTPVNIEDLQMRGGEIRRALRVEAGFSDEEARAITRATAKFRNSTFRDMGLYALEAKARSGNQAAWALKTLSGANHGTKFMTRGRTHRLVGTFVGAAAGRASFEEGDDFETRLGKVALGAGAGALAGTLAPNIAHAAGVDALASKARDWRYGYMADILARTRDALRFTVSPIFDASRYTEGIMLGQTGAPLRHAADVVDATGKVIHRAGDRFVLPVNLTPRALKRKLNKLHGPDEGRRIYEARIGQFQQYARDSQDFDPDALDSAGRWFKQVGILGFSPVDWMGTAFTHLMEQGLSAGDAYDATRRMYTYATGKGIGRARSAAEMSVNFMFFPFSFQKKALGHLAKWMQDDLGRSIIIHDALKTYELLDKEYDLESRWRDYMPFMNQLQRLNLFAYGLSAGRFGGINSQLFETSGKVAWNMFVPAGLNVQADNVEELKDLSRNMLPVINDINWMVHNLRETQEQADGFWDGTFYTRAAERSRGWNEWNEFKSSFDTQLRERGYTLEDLTNKPWLAEAKAYYEDKRIELADKYPAWWESRTESISDNIALEQQRNLMVDRYARDTRAGVRPRLDDTMIAEFELQLAEIKNDLRLRAGIESLDDAPPAVFNEIIKRSVANARLNPRWRALWDLYYAKHFGPITAQRTL
jgi:hypothetical protein